jgi:hypothetical protein
METEPFREGIDRLMKIAGGGRAAIMCSEAVWWRCHRSMISDYLKARGGRVLHILGPGKVQEHPYTSAAQIVDGRLSYEDPSLFGGGALSEKAQPMTHKSKVVDRLKVGDEVEWNSEAGRVRGTIKKRITSEMKFKGYTTHASKEEPQYLIKSSKTDHLAMHKGSALRKVAKRGK